MTEPVAGVYLCIVRWPDGTEGLLLPRPGNLANTLEMGGADFKIACQRLREFVKQFPDKLGSEVTLRKFVFWESLDAFCPLGT